jgi:hypothetical protein
VYRPDGSLPFLVEAVFAWREGLEAEDAATATVWRMIPDSESVRGGFGATRRGLCGCDWEWLTWVLISWSPLW